MASTTKRYAGSARSARGALARSAAVAATASGFLGAALPARAEQPWPSQVEASYRIAFNGIDIGRFQFRVDIAGSEYSAAGGAQVSALFGALTWQGASRSSGVLSGLSARPAGYTFDFDGTGQTGSIKLGFRSGRVANISLQPPKPPQPGTVPVLDQHLKGVLDPVSAVLALSRTSGANPCDRRVPIFDGRQRFDLVFSYARQQRIAETRPSGQPGVGFVCRVRYVPIAGYRTGDLAHQFAATEGIEVVLRPVPSADLFVPYQITIPIFAGAATLTSERIDIVTRNAQIALSH